MPNSPPNSNPGAGVRTFLASVLPEARLTDAAVNAEYAPLLLMRTKHVMAAFAFANGDMRKSYEALYGSFKSFYSTQQGQWDNLDLAFVFCVQPSSVQLDQFCSNVETDVYFCRKFVVPLAVPLGTALARLPFLPLAPLHGHSIRPPSAQTFLQQCGMPPVLAKFLVVQQERSPEGIVEDCTTGKFGEPRSLTAAETPPVVQRDQPTESVRLATLEIRNFRAYRKPQTFAFGTDVTILYGPNGFGKTSFFDAVDFAVTGGIGRVESRRQSDFVKTARHLDSGSEPSTVSLTFECNGAVRKITRSVDDRKQAVLDGRPTDRKAILSELTGGDIPVTDRVENFVSLFRASHLFSQEQQELTKDFQDDCRLSSEIVSRMLAFEDYANAVSKASRVRDDLQKVIADTTQEIGLLTEQNTTDNKELERLGQTAKEHTNVEALEPEIEALRVKVLAAGVVVPSLKADVTAVRGLRAAVEARHAQSRASAERLSLLAKEIVRVPRIRAEMEALQRQIAQKDEALKIAEEKRIVTELAVQRAEQRLAQATPKRVEAQARADTLAWVRNSQPVYARLLAQQREQAAELQRATEVLVLLRAAEDKAAGELRSREAAAAQAAEKLNIQRADLAALQAVRELIPAWQANRTRLAAVLQSEPAQLKTLESLRAEARELAPQLAAVTAEEARLARQIAEADTNQTELRTLVSRLQGHVRTGTCPLCGEDHGSKDQLLQDIQKHVAADAASGARTDLTGVRARLRQMMERMAANKQKHDAAEVQAAALTNERARLETDIATFTTVASKRGIAVEAAGPTPAEQIEAHVAKLQHEVTDLGAQYQKIGGSVETARTAVADAKKLVTAKLSEIEERKAPLARAEEESNGLRADPRLTHISLDIEPGQLTELERLNLQHLDDFRAEAAKAEADANQKKPDLSALRQETTSLKGQLPSMRTQLGSLQKAAAQIAVKLDESKLPADSNEQSLLALVADQSRTQAQLLTLRDTASSLELAIDAATTAAALTTLRQTVRNREKAIGRAITKRDLHLPWLKYFEDVSRLVASQQSAAIANFTREYGPRTSVIQRRLRSVYGFDEIEIRSRDAEISVRVKRNGLELRPSDYFSQSQQQTLLLGLFLTASGSQTWSAFSPVLLDDPVTHFDDLNTYAFLDLLVGLLESEVEKRQFVISTCDEKLLQLAQQKFRHLGDRARFYRFSAIGADGPTIAETTAT